MKKIPLRNKIHKVIDYALVDNDDYGRLMKFKWCLMGSNKFFYAATATYVNGKRTTIKMHRMVMNTPKGLSTDHINHNRLDNRKKNLRICTNRINHQNRVKKTDGLPAGIYKTPSKKGSYVVRITKDYKLLTIGTYSTIKECIAVRNEYLNQLEGIGYGK
jgi:hypothetical protein